MAPLETVINIGDSVVIERDEKLYPSKGSWPQYSGRLGTVVSINRQDAEYGVAFGYVGDVQKRAADSWFLLRELTRVEAEES